MRSLALILLLLSACARDDLTLALELDSTLAQGTLAVLVQRGERSLVTRPIGAPLPAFDDDGEPLALYAMVWEESPEVLGPLALKPELLDAVPVPVAEYEADLDEGVWRRVTTSRAAEIGRDRPPDCVPLVVDPLVIPTQRDDFGVVGLLPVSPDIVVALLWQHFYVITATTVREIPTPVIGFRAAAQAPDGRLWVATSTTLYEARWTGSAIALDVISTHRDPWLVHSLAATNNEVMALSKDGLLRRYALDAWSTIHRFDTAGSNQTRGAVTRVGDHAFAAGIATDHVIFRWEDGVGREVVLDEQAEGAMSFASHRALGLIAGTSLGHIVAESTRYRALPDPQAAIPPQSDVRVLQPFGDRIIVAGDLGWVGELTPTHELCTADTRGGATFRLAAPLGDGVLLAGQTLMSSPRTIVLSWVHRP